MNSISEVRIAPRHKLKTTPAYETYWRYASLRQSIFFQRLRGTAPPWTDDPILLKHRFTNVYRASDRVSQFLIRNVIYKGAETNEEIFFRTLLFKFFNKIETWQEIVSKIGIPTWKDYDFKTYCDIFTNLIRQGRTIYSAAYIMPNPPFGHERKFGNHLKMIEDFIKNGTAARVFESTSLESIYKALLQNSGMGRFLAFQFAIDLNYGPFINHSESEFVVAGPGASNGIKKCFIDTGGLSDEEIIHYMTDIAEQEFERLGLDFESLWGRPLQPIDCQNIFCEVDKYARIAHPEIMIKNGRFRIKQIFKKHEAPLPQFYPPKWGLSLDPIHANSIT